MNMAKKKATISTSASTYANYSEAVEKKLTSIKATPGDRIHIIQGLKDIEGILIAQNEMGNPDSIKIKLDNGYNIGIKFNEETEINKLEGSIELEKFQIRIPKQNKNLPEVSLLATGGTIASRIDYQTGGVVMAMQPEEIFASLPELFDEVSFKTVKSLYNLGSEDMNHNEWGTIAENVVSELNGGTKGVIISHGTDTMGYTAAALSFMVSNINAPVVITGAQRSSDRGSFDGAINLISAARVAAKSNIASVMVCMHETSDDNYCRLSRGTKVRKMHTSRRDAFKSINEDPLARIDVEGNLTELHTSLPRRHNGDTVLKKDFDDRITLIKIFPGITPDILDWYIDKGTKGIIIEGTGLGHVPSFPTNKTKSWLPSLKRAVEDGIFVGMTSQCLYGRVHPYVYRALRATYQTGVTYLGDMLPETALIKIGWVLGNYTEIEKIKNSMLTNYAGEISDSSMYVGY
ncbi:MAG: Glutamyl-tRNA(Gln) amidotransferase subunit D [Candidatus Heimdallarchaeota archaeon LC_2]|nr:MAG: Glutamyl-tRNA(Gln) amidotransferase subunit D [Candidatus Heimdallarchaeota archaeon LC_2]